MKKKTLTVMWMPSGNSGPRTFSVPQIYLYLCLGLLVVSLLLLVVGGYWGHRLYRNSTELRRQNANLHHEVKDLDTLRDTIHQIQKDESVIRGFLGVDGDQKEESSLGQGGEPSADLSTVALNDAISLSSPRSTEKEQATEIVARAKDLQADFHELLEAMWNQRQELDSTPSILPVKSNSYWFSSGFGWRRSPFTGLKEFHNGLDICGNKGTPIVAPADGVVYRRGKHRYLGRYLRVDHGRGVTTTYGHLSGYSVERGQKVKRGEVIGFMGNSGRSSGTHLHYSVRVKKRYVNPFHYILNTRRNRLVDFYQIAEGDGK
ncbi:MAG: M23 family metallopeptidase [Deltaproteobacteria bacterium]|nr:MAG: M23 family metallopeptidase [Deltaproteobacteria bacterium]